MILQEIILISVTLDQQKLEIKGFNVLIDNKAYFDQPVKKKQEAYKKVAKMSRNDYYTTEDFFVLPKLL